MARDSGDYILRQRLENVQKNSTQRILGAIMEILCAMATRQQGFEKALVKGANCGILIVYCFLVGS
jgi:hypothetical protein